MEPSGCLRFKQLLSKWHPDNLKLIDVPGAVEELERLFAELESGTTLPLPSGRMSKPAYLSRAQFLDLIHKALSDLSVPPVTETFAMHRISVVTFLRWLVKQRTGSDELWGAPIKQLIAVNWQLANNKPV